MSFSTPTETTNNSVIGETIPPASQTDNIVVKSQGQELLQKKNNTLPFLLIVFAGLIVVLIVGFVIYFNPTKKNTSSVIKRITNGQLSTPSISPQNNQLNIPNCKTILLATLPQNAIESKIPEVIFSDDCQKVAYIYQEVPLENEYVVINGVKQKSYAQVEGFKFSTDDKHYAYTAATKGINGWDWMLVVDGVEGKVHGEVGQYAFTADNQLIAFQTTEYGSTSADMQENFLVTNGTEEKLYTERDYPLLSFANAYNNYSQNQYLAMHGIESKQYPVEYTSRIFVSPDHKIYVYGATDQKYNPIVIENGKKVATYSPDYGFGLFDLVFSPDNRRYVYTLKRETKEGNNDSLFSVVIDGKQGTEYNIISTPVFSPDSKDVYYIADRKAHTFLVKNNIETKSLEGEPGFGSPFIISPDGKKIAYNLVIGGKNYQFINDEKYETKSSFISSDVSPLFSLDSTHFAYLNVDSNNKTLVMVDGKKQGDAYDEVYKLLFSPDSKKIIIAFRLGTELGWVVEDIQ